MKNIILLLLVIYFNHLFGQKNNTELEQEISLLNDKAKIENYWIQIHKDDQSVRGKVTKKQTDTDRQNIKKIILMFKYHGYPSGFCYGCNTKSLIQNNFTPNIVIIHNNVPKVNEYIFPILKKAYEQGIGNEFWYIHNLRGMVRNRYGRDFYEKTVENIPKYYEKLAPFVKDSNLYDLTVVDSLFNEYDCEINKILNSQKVFSKKKSKIQNNIYKTGEGKLFWTKVYKDNSFNFPQEIYFDNKNLCLKYHLLDEEIKDEILVKNIHIIINEE